MLPRLSKYRQLSLFAGFVSATSALALVYIAVAPPTDLRHTREGTPYFTPPVENPDGGDPIEVDELIRHYKDNS